MLNGWQRDDQQNNDAPQDVYVSTEELVKRYCRASGELLLEQEVMKNGSIIDLSHGILPSLNLLLALQPSIIKLECSYLSFHLPSFEWTYDV